MAITSLDLRVMQSQRMTDNADGGGRMSANEVVSGVLNNVFQDQSDLDRINGRASLRKVFLQVDTANVDTYLGAFGFLTEPPLDPNVSCLMFTTQSPTDLRSAARAYVEAYRIKANKTQYVLYGNHLAGQATIQLYCRSETPSPDIGDVFCLALEASGFTPVEQYVAVQEVASRITTTFTDDQGDFQRDVLIIRITSTLLQNLPGIEDPRRLSGVGTTTLVRSTQVTDAARYYSALPITVAPDLGDLVVQVASPYLSVVPTTTAETPLIDQPAGLDALLLIPSSAVDALSFSGFITAAANVTTTRYFGTPFARRSLSISVGSVELQDDGSGGIVAVDPAVTGYSGTVDYTIGAFSIASATGISATVTATATAAGATTYLSYSQALDITAANRQTSYVFQVSGRIGQGTLVVDFRSLGRWYRLRDTGRGSISGNPGEGSGTINYNAGSIALTLGALPDVDSPIITYWGSDVRARDGRAGVTITQVFEQQLAHEAVIPGSLTITWLAATVAKTATANSAGVISGDGTGTVDHASGRIAWTPGSAPDADYTYAYNYATGSARHTASLTPTFAGSIGTITLPNIPAQAGSVMLELTLNGPTDAIVGPLESYGVLGDNAVGGFSAVGRLSMGTAIFPGSNAGAWVPQTSSVNYTTGVITIDVAQNVTQRLPEYTRDEYGNLHAYNFTSQSVPYTLSTGAVIATWFDVSSTAASESYGPPPARITFAGVSGRGIPGSVRFTWRGDTYVDRGGILYRAVSPISNVGTIAGSYDYLQHVARISTYPTSGPAPALVSLLVKEITTGITGSVFRTPGAPLRPGSFTIRADRADTGATLTATADINGDIVDTLVDGVIDWQTGAVRVRFGSLVVAAGNEAEPWYDPLAVDGGGMIWRPITVDPDSLFVGVVIYRSIPVDPELVGLDPVRLPTDGRVPVIRAGNTVIVHHTQTTDIALPVAGGVHNLGRTGLAFIEVFDAAGTPVESVWYTQDLDAGTLTWADPLNLAAYTLPITLRDRIEDAMLCTDVQITGEITLQRALAHNYPSGAVISSAVTYGDMAARYTNLFDQATYAPGVWSDVLSGIGAAASFNDVVYPILVSNDSAIDERWAIQFTGPSTVNVIGETTGQLLTGVSIGSDIAPNNPVSGLPYFTLTAAGFGSGWSAGNVIRFNTISATRPTWLGRITKPGPVSVETDQTRFEVYGNAH